MNENLLMLNNIYPDDLVIIFEGMIHQDKRSDILKKLNLETRPNILNLAPVFYSKKNEKNLSGVSFNAWEYILPLRDENSFIYFVLH